MKNKSLISIFFKDFLAEICICSFFCSLFLLFCLFCIGMNAHLGQMNLSPVLIFGFISAIILSLAFCILFIRAFWKDKKKWVIACTVISLCYSLNFAIVFVILYFVAILQSTQTLYSLFCFAFFPCFFPLLSNVFIWHFKRQHDVTDHLFLRIFIILIINSFSSLFFAWVFTPLTEFAIVIFPVLLGSITIGYILYRMVRESKELLKRNDCRASEKNFCFSSFQQTLLTIYYATYMIFLLVVSIGVIAYDCSLLVNSSYNFTDHRPEHFTLHLACLLFIIVFSFLWGTAIIVNSKSLLTKILTFFSAAAFIPICICIIFVKHFYFFFNHLRNVYREAMEYIVLSMDINIYPVIVIYGLLFAIGCTLIVWMHLREKRIKQSAH